MAFHVEALLLSNEFAAINTRDSRGCGRLAEGGIRGAAQGPSILGKAQKNKNKNT